MLYFLYMFKQTFTKDGFIFPYWIEGIKENPPLIVIAGFTGTHKDMVDFAREFRDKYFVIVPDMPGWGKSPVGQYPLTMEGYSTFLEDLVVHLAIKKKIRLIGHCMGCAIVLAFARQYPEKIEQLFLVSPSYLDKVSNAMFEHLAHWSTHAPKIFRPFFFFFRSRVFAIPLGFFVIQSRSLKRKISIIIGNTIKQQFQREDVVEKNWNSMALFNYHIISRVSLPVHIIHGKKDILIPFSQAEKLAAMRPGTTCDILPHAGHMPPVETPESLVRIIEKY